MPDFGPGGPGPTTTGGVSTKRPGGATTPINPGNAGFSGSTSTGTGGTTVVVAGSVAGQKATAKGSAHQDHPGPGGTEASGDGGVSTKKPGGQHPGTEFKMSGKSGRTGVK